MVTKHVEVLPYDKQWKQDFLMIKDELTSALGQLAMVIEHVGSTSVEGLSAKPIIDIDVVIKDYSVFGEVVAALGAIGYRHEGDLGIKGREAFKYDGKEHLRKHHLYVCPKDSPELKRHIAFRDYLKAHPDAVREYSHIKEEGAKRYPNDIDGYIEYKSPFIEKIYGEIGCEELESLRIRKTTDQDLKRVMEIYVYARKFMAEHGNPNQWGKRNWPPEELIRADIKKGCSYVCENDHGEVVGTFFFTQGKNIEPTYENIEDGEWIGDDSYGVIHRIASDGSEKGIGSFCIKWGLNQCGHLRIDTHGDNKVMQGMLKKLGFTHCGTIYVYEDNDPRLAFEKVMHIDSKTKNVEVLS